MSDFFLLELDWFEILCTRDIPIDSITKTGPKYIYSYDIFTRRFLKSFSILSLTAE